MATRKSLLKRLAIETGDQELLQGTGVQSDVAFKRRTLDRISSSLDSDPIAKGKILKRLKNAGPSTLREAAENLGINPDKVDDKRADDLSSQIAKIDEKVEKKTGVDKIRQSLKEEVQKAELIKSESGSIRNEALAEIEGVDPAERLTNQPKKKSVVDFLSGLLPSNNANQETDQAPEEDKTPTGVAKEEEQRTVTELQSIKNRSNSMRSVGSLSAIQVAKFEKGELRAQAVRELELAGKRLDEEFIQIVMQQLETSFKEIK